MKIYNKIIHEDLSVRKTEVLLKNSPKPNLLKKHRKKFQLLITTCRNICHASLKFRLNSNEAIKEAVESFFTSVMTRNLKKLLLSLTALTVKNGSDGLQTTFYRKNYAFVKSILIFIFLLVFTGNFPGLTESVQAQDTVPRITTDSVLYHHSPQRAMMLAAAFPGLGQIYNRKYWKAPLVYIGFGTLAYFVDFNNKKYQHFKRPIFIKLTGTLLPLTYTNNIPNSR
jgi:hypothetical protein